MSSSSGQRPHPETHSPTYYECAQCGFLTHKPAFKDPGLSCPHCRAAGGERRVFPTERLGRLDMRIRGYFIDGEHEIVVILVAAFLEAILEDIVDRLLVARGADLDIRKMVLDGNRAIGGRLNRVFPQLTGADFDDVAAKLGFKDFPHRWRDLRAERNAFIHDSPFHGPQETIDAAAGRQAMELLDQAYLLFVNINNRFVADGWRSRPPSPSS